MVKKVCRTHLCAVPLWFCSDHYCQLTKITEFSNLIFFGAFTDQTSSIAPQEVQTKHFGNDCGIDLIKFFILQAAWTKSGSAVAYPCHAIVVVMEIDTGQQRFFIGHTDKVVVMHLLFLITVCCIKKSFEIHYLGQCFVKRCLTPVTNIYSSGLTKIRLREQVDNCFCPS